MILKYKKQGLTIYSHLAWNSQCRPRWPWTHLQIARASSPHHLIVGLKRQNSPDQTGLTPGWGTCTSCLFYMVLYVRTTRWSFHFQFLLQSKWWQPRSVAVRMLSQRARRARPPLLTSVMCSVFVSCREIHWLTKTTASHISGRVLTGVV